MRDRVMRGVGALLGGLVGYQAANLALTWTSAAGAPGSWLFGGVAIGVVVGALVAPALGRGVVRMMAWVLHGLAALSLADLLLGGLCLILGLLLALFVGYLLDWLPLIGPYVRLGSGGIFGYLGLHTALQRRGQITRPGAG